MANRLQREAEANALAAYDPWPSVWRCAGASACSRAPALGRGTDTIRQPVPDPSRRLIATIVNKPLLTKTDAKKYFKVQGRCPPSPLLAPSLVGLLTPPFSMPPTPDRELLAIPLVEKIRDGPGRYESYGIPTHGGYRLAQLQCLSLRAHGGVKGHEEYVCVVCSLSRACAAPRHVTDVPPALPALFDARQQEAPGHREEGRGDEDPQRHVRPPAPVAPRRSLALPRPVADILVSFPCAVPSNKRKKAPYPAMSLAMLQDFMAEMMEADYDDGYYDGGSDSMDGYDSMDGLDDLDGYPYPYFGY